MKPLTLDIFERYWNLVEKEVELFDIGNADFDEWTEDVQVFVEGKLTVETVRYEGMRHRDTGQPHGIVRKFDSIGEFEEKTYKYGKSHGFSRDFGPSRKEFALMIWRDNELVA